MNEPMSPVMRSSLKECSLCPLFSRLTPREFQKMTFDCGYAEGLRGVTMWLFEVLITTAEEPFGPTGNMTDEEKKAFYLCWDRLFAHLDKAAAAKRLTSEQLDLLRAEVGLSI